MSIKTLADNFLFPEGALYTSPVDFSCVFATGTTVTLTGLSFTPTVDQFVMLDVLQVTGRRISFTTWTDKFSWNAGTGVLTVPSATFAATDVYRCVIVGATKGYAPATNSFAFSEISPLNTAAVISETLLDATNPATQTLPSDAGLQMLGFQHLSLNGVLITAGTISIQVYGSSDPDVVPANMAWALLYGYRADTNTVTNIISCTNTTVTYAWDFDYLNYAFIKVVFTNTGAVNNTTSVYCRRMY
jgi:hypothetical protein